MAGLVPGEEDLFAGEGEGFALVVRDGWAAAVARDVQVLAAGCDVGDARVRDALADGFGAVGCGVIGRIAVDICVVEDVQGWEVLPCQTRGVFRAVGDVLREHGPSP